MTVELNVAISGRKTSGAVVYKDNTIKDRANKKVAIQRRKHRPLIWNCFEVNGAFFSCIVQGFNNKTKLTMRKSRSFRRLKAIEMRQS